MRIAFLAPDFVTEPGSSGPASYLHRMTQALLSAGHTPEVFTRSEGAHEVHDFDGVRVQRVPPKPYRLLATLSRWSRAHTASDLTELTGDLASARALADALEEREREVSFDFVQCSDWGLTGLFVNTRPMRPVVMRCCWARELFSKAERRKPNVGNLVLEWLERRSIRRADVAYAPSAYLVDYMRRIHRIDLKVVRPPVLLELSPAAPPADLPPKYLIHFGWIGPRKGTDLIARALPLVWEKEPRFTMVWVGFELPYPFMDELMRGWGERASQVVWLRHLDKPILYAVLQKAVASVLPSRVDNLPNTVIESLLLGVPVIGTRKSSIEELVEPGVTGELVEQDDVEALAQSMLDFWNGTRSWRGAPVAFAEMDPRNAVDSLLRVARSAGGGRAMNIQAARG